MKKIKDLYNNNRDWWNSFTSCFVGTLLGIGITFGISDYQDRKNKEDLDHKLRLVSVENMRKNCLNIKNYCDIYKAEDSIYSAVLKYYPDSLEYIDKKLAEDFVNAIYSKKVFSKSDYANNIINSNIEVLSSVEDISTINTINDFFGLVDLQRNNLETMQQIKNEIQENMSSFKFCTYYDSYQEYIKDFFSVNKNVHLLIKFNVNATFLDIYNEVTNKYLNSIKKSLNITDEDLNELYSDDIDSIQVNKTIHY